MLLMIKKVFQKISKNKRSFVFYLLVLVILISSVILRLYWGSQKQGVHIDEILSMTIANSNQVGVSVEEGKSYSGENLTKMVAFSDSSTEDLVGDVRNLYSRNIDTANTNFYYTLLRVSFWGRVTGNLNDYVFTGIMLNLLSYIIGFFFMYRILRLLFDEEILVLVTLFCSSFAGSAISSTMYLRSYQLQSTMLIILVYVILRIFIKNEFTKKGFIFLCCSVALSLLSGYFPIIFIVLFGLLLSVWHILRREFNKILFWAASFLVGSVITQALFVGYWQIIFTGADRAGETYNKASSLGYFFGNIANSVKTVYSLLTDYGIYYLSIFLSILFLYLFVTTFIKRKKVQINYVAVGVVIVSFIFSVIVIHLAPFKIIRYIMPVFPLIILVIPTGASLIKNNFIKYSLCLVFFVIFLLNSINPVKINFLFQNKLSEVSFLSGSNTSVCIISPYQWRFLEWIPYAKDTQNYVFFNTMDKFSTFLSQAGSKCDYAVIDRMYNIEEMKSISMSIGEKYVIDGSLISVNDDIPGFEMLRTKNK